MFGSKKKTTAKSHPKDKYSINEPIASIVGKEMSVSGDLLFTGKARLDGKVEGNIKGDCLLLSESAHVTGNIEVESLVNQGQIDGDITVTNLMVKAGGTINGRVDVHDLYVESGSILHGEVKVRSKELRVVPGSSNEATTQELFQKAK